MTAATVIAGVGEVPQGHSDAQTTLDLHHRLIQIALADAGLDFDQVDALLTVPPRSERYLVHAAAVAEALGLQPRTAMTLEVGGTAPVSMAATATGLLAEGHEVVVAVAADRPQGGTGRAAYTRDLARSTGPVHPRYEAPNGPTVPSMFALVADAYAARHGIDELDLSPLPIHDRLMAAGHPNAHYRSPLDRDTYDAARLIASPLRLFDCAPVSDGGGAVIFVRSRGRSEEVRVLATATAWSHLHLSSAASLTTFASTKAVDDCLTTAGVARSDLDVACVYDCFSIAGVVNLEDLGLAAPGTAGLEIAAGTFGRGGDGPLLNPHGGLLSHGHPARAGGMGNLVEAALQLRGEAAGRQHPSAEVALVHGMAGAFAGHGVALLGRS